VLRGQQLTADLKELALQVSTDPDHKFDLAIGINDLETALTLVRAAPEAGSETKWKVVGDKALAAWQLDLAQEAFEKSKDLAALLLLYTSLADRDGLQRLAQAAVEKGQNNIAFAAYLQLGDSASCIQLLASTDRLPEAALMARSYNPALAGPVVKKWKGELESAGRKKVAATIGSPDEDRALFEELDSEGSGVMVERDVDGVTAGVAGMAVRSPSPKKSRTPSPVKASRSPSPSKAGRPASPQKPRTPSPTKGLASPTKTPSPTLSGKADKND
jgi:coatomer subunit beta'